MLYIHDMLGDVSILETLFEKGFWPSHVFTLIQNAEIFDIFVRWFCKGYQLASGQKGHLEVNDGVRGQLEVNCGAHLYSFTWQIWVSGTKQGVKCVEGTNPPNLLGMPRLRTVPL